MGHRAVSRKGELLAATLAGGPDAVLSHRAAAELWELRLGKGREIDVIASARAARTGIRFHRCALGECDVTTRKGIRVTTPERTILDLAMCARPSELERAIRQAEYEHLTTTASLTSRLSTYEGRRGAKRLREALELATEGQGISKSKLERRFIALLRRHNLPLPDRNVPIRLLSGWVEVDCLWPKQRLIAELDSRAAHANGYAFESDRTRDRELQVARFHPIRITWRHVHRDAERTVADLSALLGPD